MNKIKMIACGGAGINVATSIAETYNVSILGLADMEITAIDTSKAEVLNSDKIGMDFVHIKASTIDSKELSGSGGRRSENTKHIANALTEYLDGNPAMLKANATDFYVLVTSLSGGTGSVIAPILASRLLSLGHNVLIIGVSDTASELQCLNSIDTLNLVTLASKRSGRNIAMSNINNSDYDTLDEANSYATSLVVSLGVFLSDDIVSIDPKDMAVLLDPSSLSDKFDVPSGIVEVETYSGDTPELDKGTACIVHREIRDDRTTNKSNAISYKRGELAGDLYNTIADKGLLPLSIRCIGGSIRNTKDDLSEKLESFKVVTILEDTCDEDDDMAGLL